MLLEVQYEADLSELSRLQSLSPHGGHGRLDVSLVESRRPRPKNTLMRGEFLAVRRDQQQIRVLHVAYLKDMKLALSESSSGSLYYYLSLSLSFSFSLHFSLSFFLSDKPLSLSCPSFSLSSFISKEISLYPSLVIRVYQ